MSKKFIVITSIFEPTEAIEKFAKLQDWQLVVVGDKKSPANWQHENVTFLSAEHQSSMEHKLVEQLPWNHYTRKMLGYLYAAKSGAEVIADTDDDNIPLDGWGELPSGETTTLKKDGFINIYRHYTSEFIWPRGLPLDEIMQEAKPEEAKGSPKVGVWQFLANEDPDVDAIYRLTNNKLVNFDNNPPVVLEKGTVTPFNSQNTFFNKELFPLLYLPAFVTFRFTDILRGLVAQPILWEAGYHLGFGKATVVQKRNPHDYMKDFESEVPVYLHARKTVEVVRGAISGSDIKTNLLAAYQALEKEGIVTNQEIQLLDSWLEDISRIH